MSLKSLLTSLINSSEKAANIARICWANSELFALLVEEKKENEKNQRFFQDFKTLADVLIQETIRFDIGKEFPDLKENIKGEESNKFTNTLGTEVVLEIRDDPEELTSLLEKVLDGNKTAAQLLSDEVYRPIQIASSFDIPESLNTEADLQKLGIWIDPIDGTNEYIKGGHVETPNYPNIPRNGLKCVTVLIGVYNKTSKIPLMGIVNQPFAKEISDSQESEIYWGVSINGENFNNIPENPVNPSSKIVVTSPTENKKYLNVFKFLGYESVFSSGAGHKILKVISRDVTIYFLSKGSTYKWDSCAGQAILNSLGGGILDYKASLEAGSPVLLDYDDQGEKCNSGGLIAFRNQEDLKEVLEKLKDIK